MMERWKSILAQGIKLGGGEERHLLLRWRNIQDCSSLSAAIAPLRLSVRHPRSPPPPPGAHPFFTTAAPDVRSVCCSRLLPVFWPFPLFLFAGPSLSPSLPLPPSRSLSPFLSLPLSLTPTRTRRTSSQPATLRAVVDASTRARRTVSWRASSLIMIFSSNRS